MCRCAHDKEKLKKEPSQVRLRVSSIDSRYATCQWYLGMGIDYIQAQGQSATLAKSTSGMRDDIFHMWLNVLDVL
jgi:hypothetical protein